MNVYIIDLDFDGNKTFKVIEADNMKDAFDSTLSYIACLETAFKSVSFKIIEDHGKAFEVI